MLLRFVPAMPRRIVAVNKLCGCSQKLVDLLRQPDSYVASCEANRTLEAIATRNKKLRSGLLASLLGARTLVGWRPSLLVFFEINYSSYACLVDASHVESHFALFVFSSCFMSC